MPTLYIAKAELGLLIFHISSPVSPPLVPFSLSRPKRVSAVLRDDPFVYTDHRPRTELLLLLLLLLPRNCVDIYCNPSPRLLHNIPSTIAHAQEMASGYHPFQMEQYLQHSLSVDTRRTWLDDDESSILDDNILDNNLLDSALDISPIDRRRPSLLESSSAIFSPSNDWDFDHDMGMAGPADDAAVPAATFEHSNGTNNPFIKLEQAQPSYAQQNGSWSSNHGASGSCTPAPASYDNNAFPHSAYEDGSAYLAPAISASPAGAFDNNIHITPHATVFQSSLSSSMPSTPAQKDWQQATGAEHDGQPMQKRMRPQSPSPRAHSPLHVMRRDGIRKKNARFDIPAERTLMNIDQLIARSNDDNEIKELKQQKRLLRNRQAA